MFLFNTPLTIKKTLVLAVTILSGLTACQAPNSSMYGSGAFPPVLMTSNRAPLFQSLGAQSPMLRALAEQPSISLEDYYRGAEGQSGEALLGALNQIVARHADLGYDQGRDIMFGIVDDLDNDDVVTGVYTQRSLSGVNNRGTAYQDGKGLNAEHSWPKSKGAGGGPAKADLHHLFPTDINTNSKRSSYPFGEVVQAEYSNGGSQLGRDARGRTVFEPRDDHKGNLARALFYFYTVYGRSRGVSLSNFSIEEPVLMQWHLQDPVDTAERARNEMVFRYQKNRNPYIDHPEFVGLVGHFQN